MLEAPEPVSAPAPSPPRDDASVVRTVLLRPEVGTAWGNHRSADQWGETGPAAVAAVEENLSLWRQQIESAEGSARRTLDQRVLTASLEWFRFTREHVPLWRTDPDLVSPLFTTLLSHVRSHFPSEEARFSTLAARLDALPRVLELARTHVSGPPAELCERASFVVGAAPLMLRAIVDACDRAHQLGVLPASLPLAVRAAAVRAGDAVADVQSWIGTLRPASFAPLGAELFDAVLHRRGLDLRAEEVLHIARTCADESRAEMQRLLRKNFRGESSQKILAQQTTPQSLHECLTWTAELAQHARTFCQSQPGIPDLPTPHECVVVDAMPSLFSVDGEPWLLVPPQRFSPPYESLLLLGEPWADPKQEAFDELSVGELECIAAHTTYPGAHAFWTTAQASTSPVRDGFLWGSLGAAADVWGSETLEGFGLLAEETMRELQFRPSALSRLVFLRRLRRKALEAVVDVELHTGGWTCDRAVDFLVQRAHVRVARAQAIVRRFLRRPTSGLSAVVGRARLLHLRTGAHRMWPHAYSDRRFLSFVCSQGPIPLSYLWEALEKKD